NTCPTPFATPTAAATAVIGAAPATIKFGDVDATGTSTAHKLTITNKSAVTASIGQITVRGPFAISGPDACSEASLLPKKPCSVELVFTPPVPTALATGSVSIQYNGLSPAVALEGTGIAVVLTAPKSESFPATAAGSSSAAKTIDISNPSAVAVTMGTAVIAGAYGSSGTDSCSGQTLAAKKGKCEVGVKFEPAAMTAPKTAEAGSLTIPFTYGANDGQVVVKLNGVVK
ncbi:MAG TPA: hypothetical protein VEJ86_03485, partial [Candidatus Binataceae bacterium]|nr:hypothetical protein [Candidatus Binataceae bacterium]